MVRHFSIRKQLILLMLMVASIAALSGYSLFIIWYLQNQKEQLTEYAQSVAQVLGQDFARIVLLDDVHIAADASAKLAGFALIRRVVLYDLEGLPVYQYRHASLPARAPHALPADPSPSGEGDNLNLYLPAKYADTQIGTLHLQIERDTLWQLIRRDAGALAFIGFIAILVALVLAIRFESRFNRPILQLIHFLETVGHTSNLQHSLTIQASNEFGQLYAEVNAMLERLQNTNQQLRIAAVAFESQDGITITDHRQRILRINSAFSRITGYTPDEVIGQTPTILKSERHPPKFYASMWHSLMTQDRWDGEIWNRRKNGEVYPQWLTIQAVRNEQGEITNYVGSFTDLTTIKSAEARIEYLGKYDPLTGLANRSQFAAWLTDSIQRSHKHKLYGALFSIDIDNFKLINETLGHQVGDQLLVEFAQRLRVQLGDETMLARLGADEFIAARESIHPELQEATLQAEIIAEELVDALNCPYILGEHAYNCPPCIGIILYPHADRDANTLIKQADTALHQAKTGEGLRWHFFEPGAEQLARHYLDLQTEIRQAIDEEQFCLHYQIQVDADGTPIGTEALIRWQHPDKGLIPPNVFIPTAERSGLILPMGQWVIHTACRQIQYWQAHATTRHWSVAINVSAHQFRQKDFVHHLLRTIREYAIPAHLVKLELTESVLLDQHDITLATMQALRSHGIQLALDDFGTGYSSLQYLRQFPFSQIKIDKSFVQGMDDNPGDAAIIRSIIELAKVFAMDVIAEGVESQQQCTTLLSMGCRHFQGYYFGRPQEAVELLHACEK